MNNPVAVLVPVFNEESTISQVIEEFEEAGLDARLHIVDNGSDDATFARAQAAAKNSPRVTVHHLSQSGKGNALRFSFGTIQADIFGIIDGDLTYFMREFHRLLEKMTPSVDMVVGDRMTGRAYEEEHGWTMRWLGNALSSAWVGWATGHHVPDVLSGQRLIRRTTAIALDLKSGGYEVETEMTYRAIQGGYQVVSVPIEYRKRPAGSSSHLATFSDGGKILKMHLACSSTPDVLRHPRMQPIPQDQDI